MTRVKHHRNKHGKTPIVIFYLYFAIFRIEKLSIFETIAENQDAVLNCDYCTYLLYQ